MQGNSGAAHMHSKDFKPNKATRPRWMVVGFVLFGLISLAGFLGLVLRALAMVRDGRGMETYRTFFLVQFNWIGVLAFIGSAIVALFIAAMVRWRENQQWRALERQYSTTDKHD